MDTSAATQLAVEAKSGFKHFLVEPWQRMLRHRGVPTLQYLLKTEAHTFAFSVAANAILAFFPFMVLIMWLIRNVFHSQHMQDIVVQLLRDHLPAGQDFVTNNLVLLVRSRQRIKLASILILLVTSTGVFVPLEVALNQIWGYAKNRSYLGNQIVSLSLSFSCGILALASVGAAARDQYIFRFFLLGSSDNMVFRFLTAVALKLFATLASIAIFFLIYWLLPNGPVRAKNVMPAAAAMGILWELSKYAYIKTLPWLDFKEFYGPFSISVTLMFWAFLSGLMLLAGAHLAAEFAPAKTPIPAEDGKAIQFS
jgi:YihY family inner membrane protein